jgi:hypothetical protein
MQSCCGIFSPIIRYRTVRDDDETTMYGQRTARRDRESVHFAMWGSPRTTTGKKAIATKGCTTPQHTCKHKKSRRHPSSGYIGHSSPAGCLGQLGRERLSCSPRDPGIEASGICSHPLGVSAGRQAHGLHRLDDVRPDRWHNERDDQVDDPLRREGRQVGRPRKVKPQEHRNLCRAAIRRRDGTQSADRQVNRQLVPFAQRARKRGPSVRGARGALTWCWRVGQRDDSTAVCRIVRDLRVLPAAGTAGREQLAAIRGCGPIGNGFREASRTTSKYCAGTGQGSRTPAAAHSL